MAISVDTMRRIDHWAGVPLCAIASVLIKITDIIKFGFAPKPAAPRKLLFVELSEMGSAIIADPAMREAGARGAEVYFLIFASNRQSLSLLNTVAAERILTIDAGNLFSLAWTTLRFLVRARQLGIDTVIDLELFSRFTALLCGLSGARNRVGFHIFHGEGLWRGTMLTHRVHYNPHMHIAKNFIALVRSAFALQPEVPYCKQAIADTDIQIAQVQIDDEQRASIASRIASLTDSADMDWAPENQRLILVNPNASDLLPQRRWPPARFSALINAMLQRWPDSLVLVTGSPGEYEYAQSVLAKANARRALNFAGQVAFEELPALYSLADVMITNDSGPAHFSAMTSLRTVVLFGPETPALYGSLGNSIPVTAGLACSPCVSAANHRKTPCTDNVCMQSITVDQVLIQVAKQLNEVSCHAA